MILHKIQVPKTEITGYFIKNNQICIETDNHEYYILQNTQFNKQKNFQIQYTTIENENGLLMQLYLINNSQKETRYLQFKQLQYSYILQNNKLVKVNNFFVNIYKQPGNYWTAATLKYAVPPNSSICHWRNCIYVLFGSSILIIDSLIMSEIKTINITGAQFLPFSCSASQIYKNNLVIVNFGGMINNTTSKTFNIVQLDCEDNSFISARKICSDEIKPQFNARLISFANDEFDQQYIQQQDEKFNQYKSVKQEQKLLLFCGENGFGRINDCYEIIFCYNQIFADQYDFN